MIKKIFIDFKQAISNLIQSLKSLEDMVKRAKEISKSDSND